MPTTGGVNTTKETSAAIWLASVKSRPLKRWSMKTSPWWEKTPAVLGKRPKRWTNWIGL